jgi:hypothetical protein
MHPPHVAALSAWTERNGLRRGSGFRIRMVQRPWLNRSITLSVIDVISCAKAELRAMIVQLQRSEKIWPYRLRAASIAGGKRILLTRMVASSPPKEANGTEIQPLKPDGPIVSPAN